jgi:hypothetical protein
VPRQLGRRIAMLAAVAAVVLTGCGTNGLTASPPPFGSSAIPTSTPPAAQTNPAATGSPTTGSVPIDETLRAHLPESVDGLPLMAAPESDAEVARVPEVVANGEAVLTALVADPANEFAHVQLIRLKPDRFSDAFFRSWRDSFDEGFCAQAGGVQGTAEAPIGDRIVFITTCAGGARAYHTWLESSRVLVAVSSVGERRLGEQLLAGLQE